MNLMNSWYYEFLILGLFCVLFLGIVVSLAVLIVFAVKKRKLLKPVIALSSFAVIFGGVVLFYSSHQISPKYNDWWVMGRTIDEVKQRYGEFDIVYEHSGGCNARYYLFTDNGPIMPDHMPHYYSIYADENGIVTEIYEDIPKGG